MSCPGPTVEDRSGTYFSRLACEDRDGIRPRRILAALRCGHLRGSRWRKLPALFLGVCELLPSTQRHFGRIGPSGWTSSIRAERPFRVKSVALRHHARANFVSLLFDVQGIATLNIPDSGRGLLICVRKTGIFILNVLSLCRVGLLVDIVPASGQCGRESQDDHISLHDLFHLYRFGAGTSF
jgi:hypothetical protein